MREGFGPVDVVNSDLEPDNGRTYPPGSYLLMRGMYGANIVLANGATAIGFQLFDVDLPPSSSSGSSLSISFGRQSSSPFTVVSVPIYPSPQRSFVGMISDTPIDYVTVSATGLYVGIAVDNVRLGQARNVANIPEPSTIPTVALGIAGLVVARLTHKRSSRS
jgi:hypothetical protein